MKKCQKSESGFALSKRLIVELKQYLIQFHRINRQNDTCSLLLLVDWVVHVHGSCMVGGCRQVKKYQMVGNLHFVDQQKEAGEKSKM